MSELRNQLAEHTWNTLVWFAALVMMASELNNLGLMSWMSQHVAGAVEHLNWVLAFALLVLVYFSVRYPFASQTAHRAAMYAGFLGAAIVVGVPPLLAALVLGFARNPFGSMTQYRADPAPVLFGYVDVGEWRKLGLVISVVNILILAVVGALWWKLIGLYSFLSCGCARCRRASPQAVIKNEKSSGKKKGYVYVAKHTYADERQDEEVIGVRVALMVPCYMDMFYPRVGVATLELLEKLGVEVDYPFDQTCCGQPMANSGAFKQAKATEELFVRNFARYEYIVAPSGSCVHHLRNKFTAVADTPERRHVSSHVWDLSEFLCDVLQVQEFPWAQFPHEVALHVSCSAIRGLFEQSMSERPNDPWFSKPRSLLEKIKGVRIVDFDRPDECCGFGGTFAVTEEAVSVAIGNDKLERIGATGVRYIVSTDMSCLMHLQGCAHRNREDFHFLHLAEVLNGGVQ